MSKFDETDESVAAHLIRCEQALLDPAVRRDRAKVDALLAEDFLEFGSSGRIWTRQEIIDSLGAGTYTPPAAAPMDCVRLAADVALVTYRALRLNRETGAGIETLRSSIWVMRQGQWRLRFHQGTPTA
jgi:hypothetical protein